jgi:polyhydroxyalkanoate synthesis regulator phasin
MESKIELELNSNSDLVDNNRQQSRFKVVKLLSTKPYSRGKWNCLDSNSDKDSNYDFNYINNNINENKQQIQQNFDQNKQQLTPNATNDLTTNDSKHNTILTTTTQQSKESTNDNNGVAIDNKIEQAMDLVKSHLMFAVREEVDVLKERIKELENEIQILRSHATNETLLLLQQLNQNQNQNNE